MTRTLLPFAAAGGLATSAVVSHSTVALTLAVCVVGGVVVLGGVLLLLMAVTSVWSSKPERRKNAFMKFPRDLGHAMATPRERVDAAAGSRPG
ncbi:hypothetical protein [Streptomyces sp. NPDC059224]|uniref:hypothetical protein n=1 Tax=Streptomyces sp. NPDC059224 TaxID=3346775 RepID=UPI00367888E8